EKLRKALEQPRGGHDWVLTSHRPKELPKNVTHVAQIEHGRIVSAGPIKQQSVAAPVRRGRSDAASREKKRLKQVASSPPGKRKSSSGKPLVVIRNADLYRDYRPVIRNLDWTLARGENWAILG